MLLERIRAKQARLGGAGVGSQAECENGRGLASGQRDAPSPSQASGMGSMAGSAVDPLREGMQPERLTRAEEANAWVCQALGADWSAHVGGKHHLMVAEPLLYCTICGRFASARRNLRGLLEMCKGKPKQYSTYEAHVRYLRKGTHPTSGERLHERPVPARVFRRDAPNPLEAAPLRKVRRIT